MTMVRGDRGAMGNVCVPVSLPPRVLLAGMSGGERTQCCPAQPSRSHRHTASTNPGDLYGRFTWKIDKFSDINKRELRSNTFEVGNYKW